MPGRRDGDGKLVAVYDRNDQRLRAAVKAQMKRLATNGKAPAAWVWDANRPDDLPSRSWIRGKWGWRTIIEEAGLTVCESPRRRKAGDPLGVPLTDDEAHAVALCGRATTAEALGFGSGLPVMDKPRQLPDGRLAWTIR